MTFDSDRIAAWLRTPQGMLIIAFLVGISGLAAYSGLLSVWTESDEYGHGLMVVGVLVYLIYRRWLYFSVRDQGAQWLALGASMLACVGVVAGVASGISLIAYYGIWLFVVAMLLAMGGMLLLKKLLLPLSVVLLLFPLPNPFGPMLTSELQLISSRLGVAFIRLMGGSVFLEGNVLDMGGSKLLVAEACAGLRYLFPLMSLGAIVGLVLQAPAWIRWVLFFVTIPITIFMNSFRIAVTGILVESGGTAHTEGFLHFFEGWVVFVAASVLFLGVAWLLLKLIPGGANLKDALAFDLPSQKVGQVVQQRDSATKPQIAAVIWPAVFVFLALLTLTVFAGRPEVSPVRKSLDEFPGQLGTWTAKRDRLPSNIEGVAGASEYYYADYSGPGPALVNVYVAYYETQRHGQIPHSPKVCIPGGGWKIESLEPVTINGASGNKLLVNRLLIGQGDRKVVTYYWLKQGAKVYRQEFFGRLDLIRSSLLENRTDGALVRIVSEVQAAETVEAADARLQQFAADFVDVLPVFVPD